jgi:hypothetical protein
MSSHEKLSLVFACSQLMSESTPPDFCGIASQTEVCGQFMTVLKPEKPSDGCLPGFD